MSTPTDLERRISLALADVAEQVLGDPARPHHVLDAVAGHPVRRDLELERQRRELVPDDVVQVAGDPQPFGVPGGRRQQCRRRPQVGVRGRKRGAVRPVASRFVHGARRSARPFRLCRSRRRRRWHSPC